MEVTLQNHSPLQELQQRKAAIAAASTESPGKVIKKTRVFLETPGKASTGEGNDTGGENDGGGNGERRNILSALNATVTLVQYIHFFFEI